MADKKTIALKWWAIYFQDTSDWYMRLGGLLQAIREILGSALAIIN